LSIEGLEKIEYEYKNILIGGSKILISRFMESTIDTFKDQSDEIANLRQELAKKEDVIEVNELKEVRNLNGK